MKLLHFFYCPNTCFTSLYLCWMWNTTCNYSMLNSGPISLGKYRQSDEKVITQVLYYTDTLLHMHFITHALYYTGILLHRHFIAHAFYYTCSLLRRHFITQALCYTETLLLRYFTAQSLYYKGTFLHRHFLHMHFTMRRLLDIHANVQFTQSLKLSGNLAFKLEWLTLKSVLLFKLKFLLLGKLQASRKHSNTHDLQT